MRKHALFILSVLAMTSCAPSHEGAGGLSVSASSYASTPQTLAAFSTTVYNFGKSQNCIKCHGASVNPQWMNPDAEIAYSFARPLLDVNNPGASLFASYVSNNHCNDPVCNIPANGPIMQDLLAQWAAVEINQTTNGLPPSQGSTLVSPPFYTATLAIPTPLPLITASQPATLRFDLTNLTPHVVALEGVILEISIQAFNLAGTDYKIFNPRISGNSVPVSVNGLHVYVRADTGTGIGTEDPNQGDIWATLNAVAAPATQASAHALVSTSLAIVVRSASDVITVGFQSIK